MPSVDKKKRRATTSLKEEEEYRAATIIDHLKNIASSSEVISLLWFMCNVAVVHVHGVHRLGRGWRDERTQNIFSFINNKLTGTIVCSVAQRKRVGLITQRSSDRNRVEQLFFRALGDHYIQICKTSFLLPSATLICCKQ